jgi:hypothetical protein
VLLASHLRADDPGNPDGQHGRNGEVIEGDLYVTGNIDQGGNTLTMGTHAASFGLTLLYDDTLPDAFRFRLARPGTWTWEMYNSTLVLTPLMRLEPTGNLTLYSNGTAAVSLNAANKSLSLGDVTLYRDSTGALHTEAAVSIGGNFSAARFTSTTGAVTGGLGGLTLNAGGTNQNVTLAPSGTGAVFVQGNLLPAADNVYALGGTNYRWSQLFVGGAVSSFGGNVLLGITTDGGNGRLQLAAHTTRAGGIGFGPDVSLYRLSPAGLATNAPELHLVNDNAIFYLGSAGDVTLYRGGPGQLRTDNNLRVGGVATISNPTNSTSSATGALVVTGGAGVGGNVNVGGTLGATDVVSGSLVSASVTSGTITGGTAGLALNAGGSNQNIVLTPSGTGATVFSGNVGIGTATPTARLEVAGTLKVAGATRFEGPVRLTPQGDLPMGEFTTEPQ